MRVQGGWITREGSAVIGHFRKIAVDANGVQSRKPVARRLGASTMDDREALEKLRALIVQETGFNTGGEVTLEGFIKSRWIPLHCGDWKASSEETITQKLGAIYTRFAGAALRDIDNVQLQVWINQLAETKSGSTVRTMRAYLKSIFSEATEQDYIRKNPARALRVPKQLKQVQRPFLSMEEIAALLKAASPFHMRTREYVLLRLVLVTGMRPSEALALRWRHVDLTPDASPIAIEETVYRGVLRNYSKTSAEGEVQRLVLPELAAQVLTEWAGKNAHAKPSDFIFCDSEGGFLHVGNYLHRVLQPLAKQAGIKTRLTFQVLRRTVLTYAASLGNMQSAQAIARHKNMTMTAGTYVQIIAADHKATASKIDQAMAPAR